DFSLPPLPGARDTPARSRSSSREVAVAAPRTAPPARPAASRAAAAGRTAGRTAAATATSGRPDQALSATRRDIADADDRPELRRVPQTARRGREPQGSRRARQAGGRPGILLGGRERRQGRQEKVRRRQTRTGRRPI